MRQDYRAKERGGDLLRPTKSPNRLLFQNVFHGVYGILSLVIYGGVIWALSYVLTQLPMGVVYAVWSGMGIALVAIIGWAVLQQPLTSVQVLCIR